jgi:seryl-tRNA synthetase
MIEYMRTTFQLFQDIVTVTTPFILAYLAYRATKKEKIDSNYAALVKKNQELEKEIQDNKKKELDGVIVELQTSVNALKKDVDGVRKYINVLSEDVKMINGTLKDLLRFNNVNLSYSQSLSCLITTIGENIERCGDSTSPDPIKKAVEIHQQKERDLFSTILKSSC